MWSVFTITTTTKSAGGDLVAIRPEVKTEKVKPKALHPTHEGMLAEYAELAKQVGVKVPDLGVEAFKEFLQKKDWPIFSLAEVISYMDKKAAAGRAWVWN